MRVLRLLRWVGASVRRWSFRRLGVVLLRGMRGRRRRVRVLVVRSRLHRRPLSLGVVKRNSGERCKTTLVHGVLGRVGKIPVAKLLVLVRLGVRIGH